MTALEVPCLIHLGHWRNIGGAGGTAYAARGLLLVPAGTLNPGDRSVRAPIGSAHDLVFLWTPTSWQPSFYWGDRRDSNPHDWGHNPVPEPFGHGHTCWSTRAD